MPLKFELPNRGPVAFEDVVNCEDNILDELSFKIQTDDLYADLWQQRGLIEALAAHHLGLSNQDTCVLGREKWLHGAFNICIPIEVKNTSTRLLMRCPMPHKLAESSNPGTVNEKISCEVGTYVWTQENCPHIRIPHLFGFGFLDDCHFTNIAHRPFYIRFQHLARRYLYTLLRRPILSKYIFHPALQNLRTGYLLLEYIEPGIGQMLSNTWNTSRQDPTRKQNLFRGIARLMLSLARVPQPRIGSFRFQYNGTITLTNRPMPCSNIILENHNTPRIMQKNDTYACTDMFISDTLAIYETHFLNEPNAVRDETDCRLQMASMTILRAVSHHFIRREYRNGPFALQFTDLHASNILVDSNWNITCLIDLEWISSLPMEMLAVPYWISGQAVDQIINHIDEFTETQQEFMEIFKEEEILISKKNHLQLSQVMRDTWESKAFWFYQCLTSVNAINSLVEDYICPKFPFELNSKTEQILSELWCEDTRSIVERKLVDKKKYDEELQVLFEKV